MKILGIGNAIVDVLCKVSDEFLTQHSLTKSTMKLIDEVEFKKLLESLKIHKLPYICFHAVRSNTLSWIVKTLVFSICGV